MQTLDTLQALAKKSHLVWKTRQTTCTYKRDMVMVTERRLWVWFVGGTSPWLIKEAWLTGDDKKDLANLLQHHLQS
jgi:hypothetical protein